MIAYFSYSGNTEEVAKGIQAITGGVLYAIHPAEAYPNSYPQVLERAQKEIRTGIRLPLRPTAVRPTGDNPVFIGSPNWWGSPAPPVMSFLASHDFTGKTLVPFCTHGGSGFGSIICNFAKLCPGTVILPGYQRWDAAAPASKELERWLRMIGIYDCKGDNS